MAIRSHRFSRGDVRCSKKIGKMLEEHNTIDATAIVLIYVRDICIRGYLHRVVPPVGSMASLPSLTD